MDMHSINGTQEAVRASLVSAMAPQELYNMITWVYLTSTRQAVFEFGHTSLSLTRCDPVDRDSLLNLILMLCPSRAHAPFVLSQLE